MQEAITSRHGIFFSLFLIAVVCLIAYSNTFHVPFQFDDPSNISGKLYVKDINAFFGAQVETDSSFIMRTLTYFTFAVNYRLHGNEVVGYHVVNLAIHILNGFLVYFLVFLTFRTPYFGNPPIPPLSKGGESMPQIFPPLRLRGPACPVGRGEEGLLIPLFAALLFVSHPVQTQAVTYIVQRLASLATLFYLLSLVLYIKWRLIKQESGDRSQETEQSNPPIPPLPKGGKPKQQTLPPVRVRGPACPVGRGEEGLLEGQASVVSTKQPASFSILIYILSLTSAILAMKTKEIAFTLPLVIALYEFLFFMGPVKKRVLYLLPLLLTMLIIPLSLMGMTKPLGDIIGDVSEATKIGSALTQWEYFFTQFRVIVTYIRLLFFPANQNLDYDYPVYHTFFELPVVLSFLFLSALFGTAVYMLYRSRVTPSPSAAPLNPTCPPLKVRGPACPVGRGEEGLSRLIAFGIFWFFMALSVESSVIPIPDVIFEHRLYLPSVGFFIAVVGIFSMVWARVINKRGEQTAKIAMAVCGLIIIILSGLTYLRNNTWRSEVRLWEDVAGKSPMKARSYNGLGLAYQKEGRLDEALESLARAVALDPSYAVAHNSLGSAYFRKNLLGRAVEEFSRAMALDPGNAIFRNNRGLAYAALGETDKAIADYLEALVLDFAYAEAYHNLGSVLYGKGLYEKAVEEYTKAITLEADNAIYYNNRGLSYAALRKFERAIADYMKAIAFKPDFAEAYVGKGVANGELGRFDAAVGDFTRAISLNPSKASSYVNRAVAYEQMQNMGMAMSDFQKACELGDARGCGGVEYMRKKYQNGK